MTQKKRFITPIKTTFKKPSNIAFADFETISINNKAYVFACGIFYDEYYDFYIDIDILSAHGNCELQVIEESEKLLQKFLIKCEALSLKLVRNERLTIYFHNLSGFDSYFILNYLIKSGKKFTTVIHESRVIRIKFKRIQFLDSFLIVNESLNSLAKRFIGRQKLNLDVNFTFTRIVSEKLLILEYLRMDVILLKESFMQVIEHIWSAYQLDLTICSTLSSVSFLIFRKHFYNESLIEIPNRNLSDYLRSGYYGGLNDVITPYGESLYVYDMNSIYPYCMRNFKMPTTFLGWKKSIDLSILLENFNDFFGFATIKIDIPLNFIIGPLPFRQKGKILFPVGTICGTFFSEEIKFAIKLGCKLITIYRAAEYSSDIIFSSFVDHFYSKKKNSFGPEKNIYKLILNSLYGRFGLKKDLQSCIQVNAKEYRDYFVCADNVTVLYNKDDKYTISYSYKQNFQRERVIYSYKDRLTSCQKLLKKFNSRLYYQNSSVGISAAVTSYARILMLTHVFNLSKDYIVYYIDTDSLVLNKSLPENLCGEDIGQFKLEFDGCMGLFLAPKVYILKKNNAILKIAFKGINAEDSQKLDWDWFYTRYCCNKRPLVNFFKLQQIIIRSFKTFDIYTNQWKDYNCKLIMDKREKIYVRDRWVGTTPIIISENTEESFV